MISWGDYLGMLQEDGVHLGECKSQALTESGERITARFLAREIEGRMLSCDVSFDSLNQTVRKVEQRRIANLLRLPPEKYIFRTY